MKDLLFAFVITGLIGVSFGSCHTQMLHGHFCTASNGVTIPTGGELLIPEDCKRCTCSSDGSGPNSLIMRCCGYGIRAGVMMAPPGCKVIADDDGCTPKFVLITDESKMCHHM